MEGLLASLGINIASNAIYDFVKNRIAAGVTITQLNEDLASFLNVEGQDVKAQRVISFMATHGHLRIENSRVYSGQSIVMGSAGSSSFEFGNNSTSTTPTTQIEAGPGAYITGNGNAQIRQNDDGSISFHV